MADESRKFPSECNPRGVVKTSDKILIWNSDTGASDEFATIAELTKIQDDAIALKVDKVDGKGLSTNDFTDELNENLDTLRSGENTTLHTHSLENIVEDATHRSVTDTEKSTWGDKMDTVYTDDSIGGTGLTANPITLRPLFERRGAVYNTETGYYELNGLTDITTVQMMDIYNVSSDWGSHYYLTGKFSSRGIRTVLPPNNIGDNPYVFENSASELSYMFMGSANIEVISFIPQGGVENILNIRSRPGANYIFYNCHKLKTILGIINVTAVTTLLYMAFTGCYLLETIKLAWLKVSCSFSDSPNLNKTSLLYMINNSAATSAIVITLHSTCYNIMSVDADIISALASKPYVSLASA